MARVPVSLSVIDRRDIVFAVGWVLAAIFFIPVQIAAMILFDSTGVDTLVPDLFFMAVVPAIVLALIPTLIARSHYTRRMTRGTAVIAFAVFTLIAAYTMQFYGMCGPGC